MKTLFSALLAATVVAAPLAATTAQAQQQRTVTTIKERPNGRTVVRQKTTIRPGAQRQQVQVRQWQRGQRFDRRNAPNYRVVSNYRTYRLAAPPRGYQWVRSNNDAVLVALSGGQIRSVVRGVIR